MTKRGDHLLLWLDQIEIITQLYTHSHVRMHYYLIVTLTHVYTRMRVHTYACTLLFDVESTLV